MSNYNVQQEDLDILRQKNLNFQIKVELLNSNFKTIELLQGDLIDDNFNIDANADVRRTYSAIFNVKDKSYIVGEESKIWLNKYIRINIGIYHVRSKSIRWYLMGTFLFDEAKYEYSPTTNKLSLSCLDMTSLLNGMINGQLSALQTEIPLDSNIRSSIITLVTQLGGITKYRIEDVGKKTPYTIQFSAGQNVYEMIKELRDLYAGWETFFDTDSTFVCQSYPTCKDDPIVLDETIINPLVISENRNISLSKVKNVTEIWGKCLDADRYTDACTNIGSQYNITIPDLELTDDDKMFNNYTISFKAVLNNGVSPTVKINDGTKDIGTYPIVNSKDEAISIDIMKANTSYVLKYNNEKLYFLGQFQIHVVVKEVKLEQTSAQKTSDINKYGTENIQYIVNPNSPYCVEQIGERKQVLISGEYENIYSDEFAIQRAEYENWKTTRLEDSVDLQIQFIPFLDVNTKIKYTSKLTGITDEYIIKSISGTSMGGILNIQMIKFYPLYPFIVED